jgi:hypothetical protein
MICWSQRNANGFGGGLIALGGHAANRDLNIGLRVVCGCAAAGNRIRHDRKAELWGNAPMAHGRNFKNNAKPLGE